jgi:CDP-diacylglycerol--glycerol-3-phosphate 3-phosphatidyltransferase
MISVYQVKPKFQQLLRPVLIFLHRMGVTANMITWSGILLSLAGGVLFWIHPYGKIFLLIPAVLFVRMAINALDGMMARTYNMQSKAGEMLNELGDVASDLFLFIPLLQLKWLNSYVILAFLFLSVINEFAGVMGKVIKGDRRYDGPMGKSDRALLSGLFCLTAFWWIDLLVQYGSWVYAAACLLLLVSTAVRIRQGLKTSST